MWQYANVIGNAFWNTMIVHAEHKLVKDDKFTANEGDADNQPRLDKIDVYFNEAAELRFVPRAPLVDLEADSLDVIKTWLIGTLFKPDNFIFGASGAGNNWAKRHYTQGTELIDQLVDVVRKECETCDCPQGFEITHSLSGSAGSGLGILLLMKIKDNYPVYIHDQKYQMELHNHMMQHCQLVNC